MKLFLRTCFLLGLAFSFSPSSRAELYAYYPYGYRGLGGSFDPAKPFASKRVCFEHDGAEPVALNRPDTPGQWRFSSKVISKREDFYKEIGLSAGFEARSLFGEVKADMSSFSEETFHSDSFTWAVIASVEYAGMQARNLRLKPEFRNLSPNELLSVCGSEVVTTEYPGAKMVALFTVKNVSEKAKSILKTAFEGGGGAVGFSVHLKASYKQVLETLSANSMISIDIKGFGGSGITSIGTSEMRLLDPLRNMDKLEEFMKTQLSAMTPSGGVPWRYVTGSTLEHAGLSYSDQVRSAVTEDIIRNLYFKYRNNESVIRRLETILTSPQQFLEGDSQEIIEGYQSALSKYEKNNNTIRDLLLRALDGGRVKIPNLAFPIVKWPRKHVTCLTQIRAIQEDDRYLGVTHDDLDQAATLYLVPQLRKEGSRFRILCWKDCPELDES